MRSLLLLVCLSLNLLSTSARALPNELAGLQSSLAKTQSLSARFVQTRHLTALRDALVTKGTIQYEKGNRLVWRTEPPSESELVLSGKTATMTYPKLHSTQAVDLDADPGMGRVFRTIRSVLEADLSALEPIFEVHVTKKSPLLVHLTPKIKALAQTISGLELAFDAHYRLSKVVLQEPNGDSTDIVFSDQVVKEGR